MQVGDERSGPGLADYQPELGRLLREVRESRSLSIDAVCAAGGPDERTLSKIERGEPSCSGQKIGQLIQALECDFAELKAAVERERNAANRQPRGRSTSNLALNRQRLDEIDKQIRARFPKLISPTNDKSNQQFSSRKLISSLSMLGIPIEIVFALIERLPEELAALAQDEMVLSTNHVRSAVARLIGGLTDKQVTETETYRVRQELIESEDTSVADPGEIKADWAARYARKFGSDSIAIQVLEQDGTSKDCDFEFLKSELIPHVLRRLLGDKFDVTTNQIISPTTIGQMAATALDEFRRLGLYSMQYKTALMLAEDLALQPPHPSIVTRHTQASTVEYDFERARSNLQRLADPHESAASQRSYRYHETVRHISSAILGIYGGYLGNRESSSLGTLRHWLAVENTNPVLWDNCDLRHIENDLKAIGSSLLEFGQRLKRLDLPAHRSREDLCDKCTSYLELANLLRERRDEMNRRDALLKQGGVLDDLDLLELARETIVSTLAGKRPRLLEDRRNHIPVGFMVTLVADILRDRSSVIFIICNDPVRPESRALAVERALDQLGAHQLSKTAMILVPDEISDEFRDELQRQNARLADGNLLFIAGLSRIRQLGANNATPEEIIEDTFHGTGGS